MHQETSHNDILTRKRKSLPINGPLLIAFSFFDYQQRGLSPGVWILDWEVIAVITNDQGGQMD